MHAELWQHYQPNGLPPSDVLRHYLLLEKEFNENAVDTFIGEFQRTLEYAKLSATDKLESEPGLEEINDEGEEEDETEDKQFMSDNPTRQHTDQVKSKILPPVGQYEAFPLVLSRTQKGILYVPSSLSRKDLALLKRQIENTLSTIEDAYFSDEDPASE